MKWIVNVKGGPKRMRHAAAVVDDKIFSFGGFFGGENYSDWDLISVFVLDTTHSWAIVDYKPNPITPFQRFGHTAISYGNKIYIWGGRNEEVIFQSVSCFDPRAFEWSILDVKGVEPEPREGHSSCMYRNRMYIFGGFSHSDEAFIEDVYYLDFETESWTQIVSTGPVPAGRDYHIAAIHNDNMYVFGGRVVTDYPNALLDEFYPNVVSCLNLTENKWSVLNAGGTIPDGRCSHSAWVQDDYIYILGGYNATRNQHYGGIQRYSITDNTWEKITPIGTGPGKTRAQVCLLHDSKVYVFGGIRPKQDCRCKCIIESCDLFILDPCPTLKTLSICVILQNNFDYTILPPPLQMEVIKMRSITKSITTTRLANRDLF